MKKEHWEDIKSADKKKILICRYGEKQGNVRYSPLGGYWYDVDSGLVVEPTHWLKE